MSRSNRGASRSITGPGIHGEPLFSEAQYIANAAEVGSVGRGIATSGYDVAGSYVELSGGLTYRTSMAINNQGADTVYIGPSGAGIAGMYPIAGSGGQINLNVTSGVRVYGITDGTSTNVRVMEIG
jgi:hypothetical protein